MTSPPAASATSSAKERGEFQVVDVFWQEEAERVGWRVASPVAKEAVIGELPGEDFRLDAGDALARFDAWLASSGLSRWWPLAAADGEGEKVFVLRHFPDGVWQIPWELLVHRLKDSGRRVHRRVSLARGIDEPIPEAPESFAEALRVLVVTGEPAGLDLEKEVGGLQAAWQTLGDEARRRIEKPERRKLTPRGLVDALGECRPHVLWFSGHGRTHDETELLAADGTWLAAGRLAGLIAESGEIPLYAVFWACDTGADGHAPSTAGTAFTPQLFERLRRIGVMSAVVVQAPIGDKCSRLLARELFSHLAGGYSLSRSLTRARARLLDELILLEVDDTALDWAAPMMWTSGTPVAALEWRGASAVRWQLLGEELLRSSSLASTPEEVAVDRPLSPAELSRAETWRSTPRTWIRGDPEDPALRRDFLRALLALQATSSLSVLWVDLRGGETALTSWAEAVHREIRPGEQPVALTDALVEIKKFRAGWQRLAGLEGVCLAITDPPARSADLQACLATRTDPTVVLTAVGPDEPGDWIFDSLEVGDETGRLGTLVAREPRLARALSVCGAPLPRKHLTLEPGEGAPPEYLDSWKRELLVEIGGRFAMASSARKRVRERMSAEDRRQAHWDCASLLFRLRRDLRSALRILRHLLAADEGEIAARHAGWLVEHAWTAQRPGLVLSILEQLGEYRDQLPEDCAIFAAAAHVALLDRPAAEAWLRRSRPGAGWQAFHESRWAQVEKARGTEDAYRKALGHVEEAIRLATAAGDDHGRRNYRQDEALLLHHNFYRPRDAAAIYRELIRELAELAESALSSRDRQQLAIIQRNYAECLRRLQEQGVELADDAAEVLAEADRLARGLQAPIRAEILYERAKTAAGAAEAAALLDQCIEVSREIGHPMMAAIADNRRFWTQRDFTRAGWAAHEGVLERFRLHAWGARTLIIGRLRAARRLQASDPPAARSQLERNRRFIETSGIATAGRRDEARIAQTYAGLAVLAPGAGPDEAGRPWDRFLEWPWASGWLAAEGRPEPEEIWQREVK